MEWKHGVKLTARPGVSVREQYHLSSSDLRFDNAHYVKLGPSLPVTETGSWASRAGCP